MKLTKLSALFAAGLLVALGFIGANAVKAASPIQLGGSIFPLTFISQPANNSVDEFNQLETLINAQTAPAPANPNYIVGFSTTQQGNPLVQNNNANNVIATVNSANLGGALLIASVSGRTIYPLSATVAAVGGNAATATNEAVVCEPSGRSVATFPVGALVSGIPVNTFSSVASIAPGMALASGCALNDALFLSNNGSAVTGAVSFTTNVPYTVQ